MNSNDISVASAGSTPTPPIHFLDFKKSTALDSVVSIPSNALLVKVPVISWKRKVTERHINKYHLTCGILAML